MKTPFIVPNSLLQFLPLTIFIGVARYFGFTAEAWSYAFQVGALIGILELVLILSLVNQPLNRMLWGANLFLIFGGIAFGMSLTPLMSAMDYFKASAIFISVGLVCFVALLTSETGVFEKSLSTSPRQRFYSFVFLGGVVLAFTWSFAYKDNNTWGGTIPFVALIFLKLALQKHLRNGQTLVQR